MAEPAPEVVAGMFSASGLENAVFDPVETAADLAARTELNDTLDELLEEYPGGDATSFDVSWR